MRLQAWQFPKGPDRGGSRSLGWPRLLFHYLGVLEEEPFVRPRLPLDAVLDSVGVHLVVERRIRNVLFAELQYLADQRAALVLVSLAPLLLRQLLHLGIVPVDAAGAVVEAAD